MTDGGRAEPEPPEGGNRTVENAVMLGFFVVLVAAGIWLLGTMADVYERFRTAPPRGAAIAQRLRFLIVRGRCVALLMEDSDG